jgi:hypothetical protein
MELAPIRKRAHLPHAVEALVDAPTADVVLCAAPGARSTPATGGPGHGARCTCSERTTPTQMTPRTQHARKERVDERTAR